MIITQHRTYHKEFTQSRLYINGGRFCYVLEDKQQPLGVKVPGETCIPEGIYKVSVTRSARWDKDMLILYNSCDDDHCIERDGVVFTGIRPHGGNRVSDTEGCPICAYESDHKGTVWSRASDDIFRMVKYQERPVYWIISSL